MSATNNKGFTMIDVLVSIIIISLFGLLILSKDTSIESEHHYFMMDYLLAQSEAILNKKTMNYKQGVRFNAMGRVNGAKTINFKKHKVIVHLGNGYITYE